MERLTEYLENNIKLAYKSVTFHFKNFVWFYLTLFIIQTFLGILTVSMSTNIANTKNYIEDSYKSHYIFHYMNTNQKYYFKSISEYHFKDEYFFDIHDIKEYSDETNKNYKCDIYITFTEDPQECFERFSYKYLNGLKELGDVSATPTPLFTLEQKLQEIRNTYTTYILILSVVSLLLLNSLYNIRANNFRFDYGIYMAFGADKRKLLNTSFWEMTIITFLTIIPSSIFAYIINYYTIHPDISVFNVKLKSILFVLTLTLIINTLSVVSIIIKTSLKSPIKLIIAKDNSNFVTSPRMSVNIFARKSLFKTVFLSLFRYRKYYIKAILSSVLFISLFVCGIFLSNLYKQNTSQEQPQFKVTFNNNQKYTEKDREDFLLFDGITKTFKEESTHVMGLGEHILVEQNAATIFSNAVTYDDEYSAFDNVVYYSADREVVDFLSSYKYSGNLDSIFENENTIIISDSFKNSKKFDFKVGDTIKLADFYTKISDPDYLLDGNELLKERLKYYVFLYDEVTIGAILHNDCSDENIKIYMNNNMYDKKTDKLTTYKTVYLYTDKNLSVKQNNKLYSDILKFCEIKYTNDKNIVNTTVENLYTDVYRNLRNQTHLDIKIIIISVFMLIFSAIIWFFSQTLFYRKRENEFKTLEAIGYTRKDIKHIYIIESFMMSLASVFVYSGISYLICFAVYNFMNSWLFMYEFRYFFDFSISTFIIGGITTFLLAFDSTFFMFYIYKKHNKNLVSEI